MDKPDNLKVFTIEEHRNLHFLKGKEYNGMAYRYLKSLEEQKEEYNCSFCELEDSKEE